MYIIHSKPLHIPVFNDDIDTIHRKICLVQVKTFSTALGGCHQWGFHK